MTAPQKQTESTPECLSHDPLFGRSPGDPSSVRVSRMERLGIIEAARPQLSAASGRRCRKLSTTLDACTSRASYVKEKYCLEILTVDGSWVAHGWYRSTGEAIRWSTYGDCEAASDSS
jgi:hypothetical protein